MLELAVRLFLAEVSGVYTYASDARLFFFKLWHMFGCYKEWNVTVEWFSTFILQFNPHYK